MLQMYQFNQSDRDNGIDDRTQSALTDNNYSNHVLYNYYTVGSDKDHINVATSNSLMFSGSGVNGSVVDMENALKWNRRPEDDYSKLMLNPRSYTTVPFLGRGTGNVAIENNFRLGEDTRGLKSEATTMEQSFAKYAQYPVDNNMISSLGKDQEQECKQWKRGGSSTRRKGEYVSKQ